MTRGMNLAYSAVASVYSCLSCRARVRGQQNISHRKDGKQAVVSPWSEPAQPLPYHTEITVAPTTRWAAANSCMQTK